MVKHTDQMDRIVILPGIPQRIISLVPSQTELLCYLGLADKIIGRTKFCIHPKQIVKNIPKIGGTKNPRVKDIIEMKPDLIIGNLEENDKESIKQLEKDVPVWMSDIRSVESAIEMIRLVGELTETSSRAKTLSAQIEIELRKLETSTKKLPQRTCLYLIWKNPYMGVGTNTYVDDIINKCGFRNILKLKPRYPELELQEIVNLSPDVVFLSSEPYPFKEKDVQELEDLITGKLIRLVDGEMFSWYGNRMLKAIPYLNNLIVNL
jgi:ABC-type Fe3+-hydroxamate transport system substrate-binding protein